MSFTRSEARDDLDTIYHPDHCAERDTYFDEDAATVPGKKTLVKKCWNCEGEDHLLFVPADTYDELTVDGHTFVEGQRLAIHDRTTHLRGSKSGQDAIITLLEDAASHRSEDYRVGLAYSNDLSGHRIRTGLLPFPRFLALLNEGTLSIPNDTDTETE